MVVHTQQASISMIPKITVEVAEEKTAILTVAENGFGKRTKIEDYPLQGRGGKGVISIKLTEKGGKVVGLLQVRDEDEVVMITGAGKLIRTAAENISIHGRNTQGVRIMKVDGGDRVVGVARLAKEEENVEQKKLEEAVHEEIKP